MTPTHLSRPRSVSTLRAATALVAGVLCASAAEELIAKPSPPSPLARDEEFAVRFSGPAPLRRVVGGAMRVTAAPGSGASHPRGVFAAGRTLIDPESGRAVVVRPEALREYFVLLERLTRDEADAKAARVLTKIERTGNLAALKSMDLALRALLGDGAGTRLDDPTVNGFCPGQAAAGSPQAELRRIVAGDDGLWRDYLVGGDITAFNALAADSRSERFFHSPDPVTGATSEVSVLRRREHRRVLMRRTRNLMTFLPDVPMRADLTDAGLSAGGTYTVSADRSLRPFPKELFADRGGTRRFARGLATFQVADDTGNGGVFLGGLAGTATPRPADPPRVVNITPPAGESFVDLSTDWEDPDDQFVVPIPQRRIFVIRIRFSRPLDPRTVDASHFTLTKIASIPGGGSVNLATAVGVFLFQRRTGEVVVEMTPVANPDPQSVYRVRIDGSVAALDGTQLGTPFVADF